GAYRAPVRANRAPRHVIRPEVQGDTGGIGAVWVDSVSRSNPRGRVPGDARRHPARRDVCRRHSRCPVLATTLIGSYPQPDWSIGRERLRGPLPARVRAKELWRIPEPLLRQAQDDATVVAIRDFERAGIDILTDGEMRRESYSNRFATALDGIDIDNP